VIVAVETVTLRIETRRRMETRRRRKRRRQSRLCQQAHPMFPTAFHAQRGDMKLQ
jgi:hypothetical protein